MNLLIHTCTVHSTVIINSMYSLWEDKHKTNDLLGSYFNKGLVIFSGNLKSDSEKRKMLKYAVYIFFSQNAAFKEEQSTSLR